MTARSPDFVSCAGLWCPGWVARGVAATAVAHSAWIVLGWPPSATAMVTAVCLKVVKSDAVDARRSLAGFQRLPLKLDGLMGFPARAP